MIDGIGDLLADDGFRTGLRYGLLVLVAVAVVALAVRLVWPVWPSAGLAFVTAGLLAIDDAFDVERDLVVGVGVLAIGGFAATRLPPLLWPVAAAPGAVLFARATELDQPSWAFATIVATTLVGGLLMADFDRAFARTGLPPVLLAVTLLGVYVTTPETQHTILLAGAALPLALLGWPRPLGSLGVGGAFAATAVVSWTVVLDGSFRPSSVVGAISSLGMFAVEPVVRRLAGRAATGPVSSGGAGADRSRLFSLARPAGRSSDAASPGLRLRAQPLRVAGLHLVLVGGCSRVAGLRGSVAVALVIVVVAYTAAGAALLALDRRAGTGRAERRLSPT